MGNHKAEEITGLSIQERKAEEITGLSTQERIDYMNWKSEQDYKLDQAQSQCYCYLHECKCPDPSPIGPYDSYICGELTTLGFWDQEPPAQPKYYQDSRRTKKTRVRKKTCTIAVIA